VVRRLQWDSLAVSWRSEATARAAAVRLFTPSLSKIDSRWACTVRSLSTSRSAISALLSPSATNCRTSISLEVKPDDLR
jgi:hypothetical protein